MMSDNERSMMKVLRSVFGFDDFKNSIQKQATIAVNKGSNDVCISMPPGFGRALCYQLPVVSQKKVAIVFSPKLSTMQNHVDFLKSKRINARLLSSKTQKSEQNRIISDLSSESPTISLLYATIEMSFATYFQKLTQSLIDCKRLSYIVYNEAHCMSEKGYDYRPYYKNIHWCNSVSKEVPKIVVATIATDEVIEDIGKLLSLNVPNVFKIPMQKINIYHDVWFSDMILDPVEHLKKFIVKTLGLLNSSPCKMPKRFAVIYCKEIAAAELMRDKLIHFGIVTHVYHHKLNNSTKCAIQNKWMQGEANVIITTYNSEFFRKQPIACIVYWTMPKNICEYYTESAEMYKDNANVYCRIYFSIKSYSSTKLSIENCTETENPEHIKRRLKEYDKLVSYCLLTECRRATISKYFGLATPPCEKCDVCNDKEKVEIRTNKFALYSRNLENVKFNLYSVNEDLKLKEIGPINETKIEKTIKNVVREEILEDRNNNRGTVQYSDTLTKNKYFDEGTSSAVQSFKKNRVVRAAEEVKPAEDNFNAIAATAITHSLMEKYNLNNEKISLKLCSVGDNSKPPGGADRTRVPNAGSGSKDASRIRASGSDGKIKTAEGRCRISRRTSCEAAVVTGARERVKKLDKRAVAVDACPEELKKKSSKRRKLDTENKSTGLRLKNGTEDRDSAVERVKDDAKETASRGRATIEYLMNKYKLDGNSITLEIRRK